MTLTSDADASIALPPSSPSSYSYRYAWNWQVVPLVELFSSKRCQLHTLFSLHCLQKDTAQIRVRGAVFCHSGRAVSWLLVGGWGAWFLLVGRMGAWWLLAGGWGAWLVLAWGAGCPGHSLAFHKSHAPESQTLFSLPQLYFTGTWHIKMDPLQQHAWILNLASGLLTYLLRWPALEAANHTRLYLLLFYTMLCLQRVVCLCSVCLCSVCLCIVCFSICKPWHQQPGAQDEKFLKISIELSGLVVEMVQV